MILFGEQEFATPISSDNSLDHVYVIRKNQLLASAKKPLCQDSVLERPPFQRRKDNSDA